ncbi:MAG: glycerophosphodiester phosphodiesterase [Devosiaceae bacterium]|nr:glycerophosphodiester phosphodiesterase [Devosiaceae bacterium]
MFIKPTILIVSLLSMLITPAIAFELQGHRGARGLMPENTLPGFAKTLSIGVTTLEFDTGVTKDGVVIISHNPALDKNITRDAKGNWLENEPLIKSLTFAELQKFDVGRIKPDTRGAKRFSQQKPIDGTRIPSLAEVFELVNKANNKTVRFNIETKLNPLKPNETLPPQGFAKALLAVIDKHGMTSRVSIQSFDWRTLQAVQKLNPKIETVYQTAQQNWADNIASTDGKASKWTADFNIDHHGGNVARLVKAAGGDVWSPFHGDLTAELIKEAQKLGLKVIPWTVNDATMMTSLIDFGVDGIISDYPNILREVMKAKNMTLPKPTPVIP